MVLALLLPALSMSAAASWCAPPLPLPPQVALIHLYQAALFADRAAVTGAAHPANAGTPGGGTPAAAHLPRLRSPSDEVRATLAAGGCPLPLINRWVGHRGRGFGAGRWLRVAICPG